LIRGGLGGPGSPGPNVTDSAADGEAEPHAAAKRGLSLRALFGAALLLAGTGAVLVSVAFDHPPSPERLGGNIPVNPGAPNLEDISAHNSPTLVRSPVDGRKLAVANRIDTPRFSCALHVSQDGGGSWRQTPIPAPGGEESKCFAPDVAFGADGTLYLVFVTLKGRANVPNAVWLSRSRDGGRTLSKPAKALGPLSFQVRLAADPTAPRRLYLTWLEASGVGLYRFTEPGNPIRLARSDDGGESWGTPVTVNSPSRQRVVAPSLAVSTGDQLSVLYLDLVDDRLDYEGGHEGRGGTPYPDPWRLVLARSEDRGETWSESVVEERLFPTERILAFLPPFPSLAVDGERVYAAFHDRRLGDADVFLWASGDGGKSFGEPLRVNDTPKRDRTAQYLPRLALAGDGRLDVLYYDRRSDKRNRGTEVSLQSSFDNGESFTRSVRLSERPFDSRVGFGAERGMPDLGSRLGLISDDERALAVWTDTRAGTEASRKQDLARALVGFSGPPRLPDAVIDLLRFGGIPLALAGLVLLAAGLSGRAAAPARAWRD
jgi:hypothetical protein